MNSIVAWFLALFGKVDPQRKAQNLQNELNDYLARARETVEEAEQHAEATARRTEAEVAALTQAITAAVERNKSVQTQVNAMTEVKAKFVG